jgi:hypothetical protein
MENILKFHILPSHRAVSRTITVPDLEKPTISIVFKFGDEDPKLPRVQVHHQDHLVTQIDKTHPNDNHCLFIARG